MERYLTPPEQQQLLNAARRVHDPLAQRDYHLMAALLASGCRVGEFTLVKIGDVLDALSTKYLFIPREHRKGGARDHKVFLTQKLRLHLVALLQLHDDAAPDAYLLPGREDGQPMTVRNIQQRVRYWAAEAGLPMKVTPHFFRHSRGMDIMRSSQAADPRAVAQAALGHANLNTTLIYTAPAREDIESALEQVDAQNGRRQTLASLRKGFERRAG